MSEAVLFFTFSPVQAFISETRRTSDLFVASSILVRLAKSAGKVISERGRLVYPSLLEDSVPNKLVAIVPWSNIEHIAEAAKAGLLAEWDFISCTARRELENIEPYPDGMWQRIWTRQRDSYWEVYWAAASLEKRTYAEAYREADRVLAGLKRTRVFQSCAEPGPKDTLSGCRQALCTRQQNAKDYWAAVSEAIATAKLKPNGRERLDTIGAVKRFCDLNISGIFPSTSSVASSEFLEKAKERAGGELALYRKTLEKLLGKHLYKSRPDNNTWPYDGDLLYMQTLSIKRLQDSYGVDNADPQMIEDSCQALDKLYKKVKMTPTPYYGLLVLDGDDMGKRITEFLGQSGSLDAHSCFSFRLTEFASHVRKLAKEYKAHLVYNGGDDTLALAPLTKVLPLANALADKFYALTGCSASAGVAIAHHLYPLDTVIRTARHAEREAKKVKGKNGLCVTVLKRGSGALTMYSKWVQFRDFFNELVTVFDKDGLYGSALSSGFAYDASKFFDQLTWQPEIIRAELKRLLLRHSNKNHPCFSEGFTFAERLWAWAEALIQYKVNPGHWLVLARFIAGEGGVV